MQLVSHCLISGPQQNSLPAVSEGRQTERQHSSTGPCSDRRQTERQHSSTGLCSDRRQTERQYTSTVPCSDTCMQTTVASSSLFSCTTTHHSTVRCHLLAPTWPVFAERQVEGQGQGYFTSSPGPCQSVMTADCLTVSVVFPAAHCLFQGSLL